MEPAPAPDSAGTFEATKWADQKREEVQQSAQKLSQLSKTVLGQVDRIDESYLHYLDAKRVINTASGYIGTVQSFDLKRVAMADNAQKLDQYCNGQDSELKTLLQGKPKIDAAVVQCGVRIASADTHLTKLSDSQNALDVHGKNEHTLAGNLEKITNDCALGFKSLPATIAASTAVCGQVDAHRQAVSDWKNDRDASKAAVRHEAGQVASAKGDVENYVKSSEDRHNALLTKFSATTNDIQHFSKSHAEAQSLDAEGTKVTAELQRVSGLDLRADCADFGKITSAALTEHQKLIESLKQEHTKIDRSVRGLSGDLKIAAEAIRTELDTVIAAAEKKQEELTILVAGKKDPVSEIMSFDPKAANQLHERVISIREEVLEPVTLEMQHLQQGQRQLSSLTEAARVNAESARNVDRTLTRDIANFKTRMTAPLAWNQDDAFLTNANRLAGQVAQFVDTLNENYSDFPALGAPPIESWGGPLGAPQAHLAAVIQTYDLKDSTAYLRKFNHPKTGIDKYYLTIKHKGSDAELSVEIFDNLDDRTRLTSDLEAKKAATVLLADGKRADLFDRSLGVPVLGRIFGSLEGDTNLTKTAHKLVAGSLWVHGRDFAVEGQEWTNLEITGARLENVTFRRTGINLLGANHISLHNITIEGCTGWLAQMNFIEVTGKSKIVDNHFEFARMNNSALGTCQMQDNRLQGASLEGMSHVALAAKHVRAIADYWSGTRFDGGFGPESGQLSQKMLATSLDPKAAKIKADMDFSNEELINLFYLSPSVHCTRPVEAQPGRYQFKITLKDAREIVVVSGNVKDDRKEKDDLRRSTITIDGITYDKVSNSEVVHRILRELDPKLGDPKETPSGRHQVRVILPFDRVVSFARAPGES